MSLRHGALGVVSLLLLSPLPAALGQIPSSAYERVADALEQGNFSAAEQLLRPALREHPGDSRALGLMGVVLDAQKRYDEAEGLYERALKLDPVLRRC